MNTDEKNKIKLVLPVETIPGIGGGGWRRAVEGVNSSMITLIHYKNLCKCHDIPPPAQQ
jgi:hypothetical protein